MSSAEPAQERKGPVKPQRVLACVLCQQRKVKCDRRFPCANCNKAGAQCVPAVAVGPRRRRRFPERELLSRLRHYEELLSKNRIKFDPMHPDDTDHGSVDADDKNSDHRDDSKSESEPTSSTAEPSPGEKTPTKSRQFNIWRALSKKTLDPEKGSIYDDDDGDSESDDNRDVHAEVIAKAWDRTFEGRGNDHLLFGSPESNVDLSTLHPQQAQIFRLWQVYLENVDPLLKVTHTPTLQARIIDAACDTSNISPPLEALIFSIYALSVMSLDDDKCLELFGIAKMDLLSTYRFGCRQALQNCNVLRSSDRDALTALLIYLLAVRSETDPRSLSSMLGMALRIAKRIGIHNKNTYERLDPLEAEISRRLWWSLVMFDNRICEMFDYQNSSLVPTWDCELPVNVNDADVWLEMNNPPVGHQRPTEALFAVVRSDLGDLIRHSSFHLDYINPRLKALANYGRFGSIPDADKLAALEKIIEDKYLAFCNQENPIQFLTLWFTRASFSKSHLLEYYSRNTQTEGQQAESRRNAMIFHAIRMLECDTKLITSPLTMKYWWFVEFNFPFPAYMHLLQELKQHPLGEHVMRCWEVMSNNYGPRSANFRNGKSPMRVIFSRMILQAWRARETALGAAADSLPVPGMVAEVKRRLETDPIFPQQPKQEIVRATMDLNISELEIPLSDPLGLEPMQGTVMPNFGANLPWSYDGISRQGVVDVGMDQLDWTSMDWNAMYPGHGI
ncbi:hypothetical protein E8E14_009176 [Neopestalotiopsis sp. 37M]|nr:hypothetical protein E8E14_009176 [Neopestalotiopsis sp. 37M]